MITHSMVLLIVHTLNVEKKYGFELFSFKIEHSIMKSNTNS